MQTWSLALLRPVGLQHVLPLLVLTTHALQGAQKAHKAAPAAALGILLLPLLLSCACRVCCAGLRTHSLLLVLLLLLQHACCCCPLSS
jgi:hypothetical protein